MAAPAARGSGGAVRVIANGEVYRQLFEDEARWVRSLGAARRGRLRLHEDLGSSAGTGPSPCNGRKETAGAKLLLGREATASQVSWKSEDVLAAEEVRALPDLVEVPEESRGNLLELVSECRRGRHGAALTSMHRELACVAREIEPFVLEPGDLLLTKLMESDRKMDVLTKMELDATLEGFSIEDLEELWMTMQQESLTRKEWVREWNETLKKVEWSRADKITDVLRKYTAMLEEISFLSSADVHRFINDEAMMINRALLANQRAIAKLFFNLMKSEMKRELSLQLKWRDRVKDWRLIRKNCIIQSFREFMAKEEIQDPQMVKIEMENMMSGQILLNERRLELLQHLTDLLPPASTQAEINEWYSSLVDLNRSIDAHNMQCTMKIRAQYESVEQKCLAEAQLCKNNLLNLKVCTQEEAEEMVASDFLLLTEKLRCRFEEELEHMIRGFEELAKCNKQNCRDLYSYCKEASVLWDIHQLKLSQLEGELQKKLDECRWKQDKSIQVMETNLAIILDKMRTASSEKNLKKSLKNALSSLDGIRAEYEASNKVLMEEVTSYPEAILQELISYSESLSQYFNVKEIFKQNLEGKIDSMFPGQAEVLEAENPGEQQTESVVQENEEKQKADSCQQQNERTNIPENEKVFAQESEEREEQEDGESTLQGSDELDDIEQRVSFPEDTFNSSKVGISEIAVETFSTSSGNTYTVLGAEEAGKPDVLETHLTKYDEKGSLPMYLEHVLIKETVFVELKKRVRLCFFEHLEKWFAESLSNLWATVGAKKEELSSELRQHLLSCELRQENIETNIYSVRAEELLLHKKCLEHHCHEVGEALKKERAEFLRFCDQQNDSIQNLDSRIRDMEPAFLRAPVAEQLDSSSSSVCPELLHHLDVIRVSLRSYRNYLEETLGKLRDSNVDFLKGCRLFVEGGNFSPEEVQSFSKRLQKESKHIDSLEKLIVADMEKMESSCLEQATEVINQAETRFHCLFMNRVFMEKIQQLLTNLRVQIKSEVANSNVQAAALKSCLEKLCAFAHPTADEESLTSEELYDFIKVVIKELKARSQYLDCLLVNATIPYDNEHFAPPAAEVTLRGPIAAAIRAENKLRMMGLDPVRFPLLNPSRMGKSAIDDLSVSVIKNLLGIQSSRRKSSGLNQDSSDSLGPAILPTQKKSSHLNVPDEGPQRSDAYKHAARNTKKMATEKRTSRGSMQKCTRSVLSDKRFQIFGEKPPESNTFKGIVMNILWTGNNNLLCLAEEFYHKEKHQITMPEDLPETFERCAEVLRQNLLSYQSQIDDYYNSCLKEFWDQLKLFEEELPYVSQLAVDALLKEHEQKLSCATSNIQHSFNQQLEDWRSAKAAHKKELRPSLGHPDNSLQLEALCQRESKLQKDHVDAIHLHTRMLRDRAAQCAQNFVSALAAFTEKLLLELDESITIDDIQVPKLFLESDEHLATWSYLKATAWLPLVPPEFIVHHLPETETPREKTSTLIHRKQAGLPLQTPEAEQLVERGSRTWPGIPMTTLVDDSDCITFRETASVTAAKTTLGHVAAVEARDAVYKKYIGKLEQQFAQIKEESTSQLVTIQRWENWWNQSIQKIKQLYT
ncbi:coiled-coil domain-containing protein 180 isoform X2 [Numida meleagris]|uniref:coiled-coil domain-containing protein 180 isoform X2 n=1 Tax=Numida meleagris TaxID=8996 RepID=UPI000B3DA034|nr:coiled-coil domain-containing protein 180 isoform X2 [Numida meleagris]